MKRSNHRAIWPKYSLLLGVFVLCFSTITNAQEEVFKTDLKTEKKPWTHLNFANDPNNFQFAIVTDRTGSPRAGIFEDAVKKLNWMNPEFVITVGDLIKGANDKDSINLNKQWADHFKRIAPLKMPFFHLAGNHDIKANNPYQVDYWNKMFGATYYSFVYKDVLFLGLFTNQGTQILTDEQVDYFSGVLEANKEVRWTMVFMHHPLWRYPHMSNFEKLEDLLKKRKYTVFAGHQHRYHYSKKNDANYYVLATTGGGSELLGSKFGTFDHFSWVTMTDDGPQLANLRLDGILPHDITDEATQNLAANLIKSVNYSTEFLGDSKKAFTKGKIYITYTNDSDLPIKLSGRFYHNHHVLLSPDKIKTVVPANGRRIVEVAVKAIEPIDLKQNLLVDFEGSMWYDDEEYAELKLTGKSQIRLKTGNLNLLPTKYMEYLELCKVTMQVPPLDGEIRYTLDGSEPKADDKLYTAPFLVKKETLIKAKWFSKEGWQGKSDKMEVKPIKKGKGLLASIFQQDQKKPLTLNIPDFDQFAPISIRATNSLDPVKTAGQEEVFGLVYKGNIRLKESGKHTFNVISDDGFKMYIDGKLVVEDAVKHKARVASGTVDLKRGTHEVRIHYFQWKRGYALDLEHVSPRGKSKQLTANDFYFDTN